MKVDVNSDVSKLASSQSDRTTPSLFVRHSMVMIMMKNELYWSASRCWHIKKKKLSGLIVHVHSATGDETVVLELLLLTTKLKLRAWYYCKGSRGLHNPDTNNMI